MYSYDDSRDFKSLLKAGQQWKSRKQICRIHLQEFASSKNAVRHRFNHSPCVVNKRRGENGAPTVDPSNTEGVTLLWGYSPSHMKLLPTGEDLSGDEVVKEDRSVVMINEKVKQTPYNILRAALDDAAYDPEREILDQSQEGRLAKCTFPSLQGEDWVLVDDSSDLGVLHTKRP